MDLLVVQVFANQEAARQACLREAMVMIEDPRIQSDMKPMPFDGKGMINGGFETIIDV